MSSASAPSEVVSEPEPPRFAFGRNWSRFLRTLTEERIHAAENSLLPLGGYDGLKGRRFLDIGCGSGLFSLAAYRLGADVVSFDFDADSVGCTLSLQDREQADATHWDIRQGSVLDEDFLISLGEFDIVYSWGVLHHTGEMWTAIELAARRVKRGGLLCIALYNDQGPWSRVWLKVKEFYNRCPRWLQPVVVVAIGGPWMAQRALMKLSAALMNGLFSMLNGRRPRLFRSSMSRGSDGAASPNRQLFQSQRARGMHWWYDLVDWIGGYPFEVAKPEDVLKHLRSHGFELTQMTTCGGNLGCNEFVFHRTNNG